MESSRVLVLGLPEGTTATDLKVYFQSIRDSEGGYVIVKEIDIDGRQAFVTFKDVQAASRIVFGKRKHSLKSYPLIVSLLPEAADSSNTEDEEDDTAEMDDQLGENRHGAVSNSPEHHLSSNYNRHHGAEARIELVRPTSKDLAEALPPLHYTCKVKVTGLSADTSEDLLTNYFENTRRSKGGPISSVDIDRDLLECLITFESPDDAVRTVESSPHKVGGLSLDVSFLEKEDDPQGTGEEGSVEEENITIIVTGTLPSEDALWNYFENERRSGGGEVLKMAYTDEGDAIITFAEVKDLKRLLDGPHSIDKKHITVARRLPDPLKVHVQGLNETTSEDCLRYYLEKFSTAEVSEVYKGCNNNALAVFDADPDFPALFNKVSKDPKGLEGRHLRLERVPMCSSIQVKGLKKETSNDTVELYFENNRKSGGSSVNRVEEIGKDEVLVYFEDPSSVQSVIKRSHVLEGRKLDVKPHYPFLENATTNKTEIAIDADVYNYIKVNHQHELQAVLDDQKVLVELSEDFPSSTITIFPSEKKNDSLQLWQERVGGLKSFLKRFKKTEIHIAAELFDEITQRWQKGKELDSAQGSCNSLVSFDARGRCAQIIGRKDNVEDEEIRLRELIDAAQKDKELMNSIVEADETDIPNSRLALLKMSGIGEKLQNEHRHLAISFDLKDNRLLLKGPSSVLQEVKLEIYRFSSKVIEQALELSKNLTAVLEKSAVSDFLQNILKKKEIQALLVYNQDQNSNEVKIVGDGHKNVTDAEMMIQSSIQERSLDLTHENMLVLEGLQWKDFQSKLVSTFKIGVFVECSSNTLWVSGIKEDVNTCFERVKQFLDVNTILHNTVPMDQRTTRFIVEKWGSKLESMKTDLADCCIDFKAASDFEGIEVSGTTEGLEKCLPKLRELTNAVSDFTQTQEKEKKGKAFLTVGDANPVPQSKTVSAPSQESEDDRSSLHYEEELNHNKPVTAAEEKVIHSPETVPQSTTVSAPSQERKDVGYWIHDAQEEKVTQNRLATAYEEEVIHWHERINDETFTDHKEPFLSLDENSVGEKGRRRKQEAIESVSSEFSRGDKNPADRQETILVPQTTVGSAPTQEREDVGYWIHDAEEKEVTHDRPETAHEEKVIHWHEITKDETHTDLKKPSSTSLEDNSLSEQGRRKQEAIDLVSSEYSRGDKNPANRLETILDIPAGKVKVSVYKGDITNERVDVIVNATNTELQHVGGVSKAILDKGGKTISEESTAIIRKRGALKDGEAVNTKSGNLHCKAVVHAVGPIWKSVGPKRSKKVLRRACMNSFLETEKLNMTSIALPAIGSGMYGMPKDVCAEVMFDAVDEFVRQGDAEKIKISDIRFVNIDDPSVQAFKKEFYNRYGDDRESSSSKNTFGGRTTRFSPTEGESGGSSVPTSRSNRNQSSKNDRSSFGSSSAGSDQSLSPSSHPGVSNSSSRNAMKANTTGRDTKLLLDQQSRGLNGKRKLLFRKDM